MIAIRLVINNTKLPCATAQFASASHTQITESGGTSEAATATHAIESVIFSYPNTRNQTTHDASAIARSIRVGSVLMRISSVSWVSGIAKVTR